jgi:hypothetical protein
MKLVKEVTWSHKYQHYRHLVTAAIASLVIYLVKVVDFHMNRQAEFFVIKCFK